MKIQKIYVGSWFQRTMLHLSEIYDFLEGAGSPLDGLDPQKLLSLKNKMDIDSVELHPSYLDHLHVYAKNGISIKIYEDGLIALAKDPEGDIEADIKKLTTYYEKILSPGLKYIFSLGAPVPKELANIKTVYPYFVVLDNTNQKQISNLLRDFNQTESFYIKEKTFEVHRGDLLYIINNLGEPLEIIEDFIQEQIFIREFKAQLHRYLNLHRIIWEKIAVVKERGEIVGKDIKGFRDKVEGYSKAINLIESRINQMGIYIGTRSGILKKNTKMEPFMKILEFKHEKLNDTLSYVKQIWSMTRGYVGSTLDLFSDLQAKATNNSIQNLTVVTSMGVGATLIGLFTKGNKPEFTTFGILYFIILAFIGYITNRGMRYFYINKTYKIKDIKADQDIK